MRFGPGKCGNAIAWGGATERGYAPVLSIMEMICVTRHALAAVTVTIWRRKRGSRASVRGSKCDSKEPF